MAPVNKDGMLRDLTMAVVEYEEEAVEATALTTVLLSLARFDEPTPTNTTIQECVLSDVPEIARTASELSKSTDFISQPLRVSQLEAIALQASDIMRLQRQGLIHDSQEENRKLAAPRPATPEMRGTIPAKTNRTPSLSKSPRTPSSEEIATPSPDSTRPQPPKIQTKFHAIDLNEKRRSARPSSSDLQRMRDGSIYRPYSSPKKHMNEEWRRYELKQAAELEGSPLSGKRAKSAVDEKQPSESILGKLTAKAIKDASSRSIFNPAFSFKEKKQRERINRKWKLVVVLPRKAEGIFPQAEARERAVQRRIEALGEKSRAIRSRRFDGRAWTIKRGMYVHK